MRVLTFWSKKPLEGTPFTFEIVPPREIREGQVAFDQILAVVRAGDFSYTLVEHTEQLIEGRMRDGG